jgi:RNA polymerase sigma-70 factor (ECF subfamily)
VSARQKIADAAVRPAGASSPAGHGAAPAGTGSGTGSRQQPVEAGAGPAQPPVACSDDQLMRRVVEDDEDAFRQLVERWQQPVFAFLARMVASREDALDLSQEVFARVHRERSRYRGEDRFRSWIFRIAGNLARSWLRRRRILHWIRFDAGAHDRAAMAAPADQMREQEQLGTRVRGAIAGLPERQRQALLLRRYEELSCEEIAQTLGTSASAVESLLQRAMASLRRDLGPRMVRS